MLVPIGGRDPDEAGRPTFFLFSPSVSRDAEELGPPRKLSRFITLLFRPDSPVRRNLYGQERRNLPAGGQCNDGDVPPPVFTYQRARIS